LLHGKHNIQEFAGESWSLRGDQRKDSIESFYYTENMSYQEVVSDRRGEATGWKRDRE
jgi:hypothetical protein